MPMPRDEFRKMSGYNDFTAYTDFDFIGRGGSGSVYSVIRDDTRYAMKIPIQFNPYDNKTVGKISEDIMKEFKKEADRLNNLSNKCSDSVVTMEDFGTIPFPWIVMEFADGDLRTAIDNGNVDVRDLINILRSLDRIHCSGFHHLDIKPENIMRVGRIWKFTDFGLSNPINKVSISLSKKGFTGTVQYSAPEQISETKFGKKDDRTDIWQMAAVIYEVLAKRRPYDSDDILGVSELIREGGPDLQYVPEEYRSVLSKAFQVNKDSRYERAADFADALEAASRKKSIIIEIPKDIPNKLREKYESAVKGDVDAQVAIAYYYENEGKESSKAIEWYTKAAEGGHLTAQFYLGSCYYHGVNVEKDIGKALKWLRTAAEKGEKESQFVLGTIYRNGEGVDKSLEESAKWLKLASDQNHEEASKLLKKVNKELSSESKYPPDEHGISRIPKRQFWKLPDDMRPVFDRAMDGDTKSQIEMGRYCFDSNDGENALNWFIEASKKDGEAFIWLYRCYAVGANGISYDPVTADHYLKKAKDLGFDTSNIDIDSFSDDKMDLYRDAIKGDAIAQFRYGAQFINTEEGIKEDYKEAVKWFLKSAENHYVVAQRILAMCYGNGLGTERNLTEAVRWYRIAAVQGDAESQYRLGLYFEKGRGVDKDIKEAKELYAKAAAQGHKDAIKALERFEDHQQTPPSEEDGPGLQRISKRSFWTFPSTMRSTFDAAMEGDTKSQIEMGKYCYRICDKDAVDWFTEASKKDPAAYLWLYHCYSDNRLPGVPYDKSKSDYCLEQARKKGYYPSEIQSEIDSMRGEKTERKDIFSLKEEQENKEDLRLLTRALDYSEVEKMRKENKSKSGGFFSKLFKKI